MIETAERIFEIRDNPTTMTTDVEVEHVLEYIRDQTLGSNPWKATLGDGVTLGTSMEFRASDFDTLNERTATPLRVVDGTPANNYETSSGRFSFSHITGEINRWLNQARLDGGLAGFYGVGRVANADGTTHGRVTQQTPDGGGTAVTVQFNLSLPPTIYRMLGTFPANSAMDSDGNYRFSRDDGVNHSLRTISENGALRAIGEAADLENEFGEFFDQSTSLPDNLLQIIPDDPATGLPLAGETGVVMLNDTQPVVIVKSGSSLLSATAFDPVTGTLIENAFDIPWEQAAVSKLRQIFIARDTFANVLKKMILSTGTTGFNHPDYDVYPGTFSLGIPYDMATRFIDSVDRLAHADQEITIIIDRPKKFIDIFGAALKFRFAFFRWIRGAWGELASDVTPLDPVQREVLARVLECWRTNKRPLRLPFVDTDAGRAAAGFAPWEDCMPRALATATGIPYRQAVGLLKRAWEEIEPEGKPGFDGRMLAHVLRPRGWRHLQAWGDQHLHLDDLPTRGRLIVQSATGAVAHTYAVIDGAIVDCAEGNPPPTAAETPVQCVFGYWYLPSSLKSGIDPALAAAFQAEMVLCE